jgi:Putative peptidoglycan binding domain
MKRIFFLALTGTVALTLSAWGAPNNRKAARSANRATIAHGVTPRSGGHVFRHAAPLRTSRAFSAARMRSPRNAVARSRIHSRSNVAVHSQRNLDRGRILQNRSVEAARLRRSHSMTANARATAPNTAAVNRARNVTQTRNQASDRVRNTRIVNNWRGDRFRGQNYAAFRNYHRHWHDHSWWRSHYTRIILVGGGWWYSDAGYWYPAWGYDSSYSYYPYDGPIYGYGDLTPDQVIINVQTQLRNDGYYAGSIDGLLGPETRRAISAFQADHGLAVTSSVDEPTLATLGLS